MVFRIPWDETKPLGTFPADVIDNEIRNVKTAVSERLSPIVGWDIDDEDPKKFTGWFVGRDIFLIVPAGSTAFEVEWTTLTRPTSSEFITIPDDEVTIPPRQGGLYLIGASLDWDLTLTSEPGSLILRKNGVNQRLDRRVFLPTGNVDSVPRIFSIFALEEGDILQIIASNGGVGQSIIDSTTSTKFWGLKLGG